MKRISLILFTLVFFTVIVAMLFINKQSASTPRQLFESNQLSYTDFEYEMPHRKYIPLNEIAVLPMEDYMVLYISYVCDSENSDDINVVFRPMKIVDGCYYSLPDSSIMNCEKFENENSGSYESSFHSVNYNIIPKDAFKKEDFTPETYNFINANYINSKGEEQDVVFCYTYKINWNLGDGSVPDKF